MQNDFEVHSSHNPEYQIQQEERGCYARLRLADFRYSSAFIGIPEWHLMKVHKSVIRIPSKAREEVPIVEGAELP